MFRSIIFLSVCLLTKGVKFPAGVQRCPIDDSLCFQEQFNYILKHHKGGVPTLGVPSIDPLKIESINILDGTQQRGQQRPINIVVKFHNVDVIGLSKYQIYDAKGFDKLDLKTHKKTKIELKMRGNDVRMKGKYEINGNVLVLPIQGKGDSEMKLSGFHLAISMSAEAYEKNGKRYVKLGKPTVHVDISKFTAHFDNLFNGDKVLGQQMNAFLNENWRSIYEELKPAIVDSFAEVISAIINNVLNNVPYDDLFITDQ